MKRNGIRKEYLECECWCEDHLMQVRMDTEDKDTLLDFTFKLTPYDNIFKRVGKAFKYIIWRRYDYYDNFLLQEEDCDRLINLIKEYQTLKNK